MSVSDLLTDKRVCVCGGSGGVGKTTTSAAIALGMAARGAKVAVVTIDPARRLANALGLRELENEPRRVEPERLAGSGIEMRGELWAMMLDPKRTFDELIDRVAPDPARAQEIKENRVYRELSTAVSGSQEFTAVAKLYELERDGDFDLLVLDTPPSRNALDFLDAPGRLTSFLEGRALKAFIRPTGLGMRVFGRGAAPLLAGLRRVTGIDLIGDLSTFFGLLGSMTEDFSVRARQVEEMLRAPTTAFLLVTSAQQASIDEAIWFRRTLTDSGLPFAGVIVNRVGSDIHEQLVREAITDIPVLGALRRDDRLTTPERHLGLVPAAEREPRATAALGMIAEAVAAQVDLAAVERLAWGAPPLPGPAWSPEPAAENPDRRARVAIARGPAFSFHYEENLELLTAAGAELLPFDPVTDEALPDGAQGLILAGGFPEVFGAELAAKLEDEGYAAYVADSKETAKA
jgi:anion-transporting  ArsA/GET3 family ATPase